jgi:riboflavin kinase/FMN adenylyltransferase
LTDVQEKRPTFLAVGVFDGVHRGHQALLQQMARAAEAQNARPAVLTFFPHPITVIRQMGGRIYLSTLEERVSLLREQGISLVITYPFNETVRQTKAADFVSQLCQHLEMTQLWGGSFSLGHNREGDLPFLQQLGKDIGYTVQPFESLLEWEGERISSSRIRRALAAGNVAEVNACLGRSYSLTGTVSRGEGRGRTIGIPTANLQVWEEQHLPANGVYATIVTVGDETYTAATNIGVRPTVDGQHQTIEAHLLDFDRDLYGQEVRLSFIGRIRDEQKFSGLDALVAQIHSDIAQTREMVARWP